jgi:endonuclease YncB( thermonuclease family)
MNKIILIILLFLSQTTYGYMLLPIGEVYDGDTIKTHFNPTRMPEPLNKVSVRIRGIDTPEKPAASYWASGKLGRAKCKKEAELALLAKQKIINLVLQTNSNVMKVSNFEHGKYGGRIVADVRIGGTDVADMLIRLGLAVPYDGGTKKHDWCSE